MKLITAHDLVNVYYVKPVFAEKQERKESPEQPKPDLPPAGEKATGFWGAPKERPWPKAASQTSEKPKDDPGFQLILNEIGAMGNKLEGIGVPPEEVAKKYERKVVSSVAVKPTKNRNTKLENLAEKQRVKEITGINPKHVDVVKYNKKAKGWVVTASRAYILLRNNDKRFLIHSGNLASFLKGKGQTYTTMRTSRNGKKLTLNGVGYPFKAL